MELRQISFLQGERELSLVLQILYVTCHVSILSAVKKLQRLGLGLIRAVILNILIPLTKELLPPKSSEISFSKNLNFNACVFVLTLRKQTDEHDAKLEETKY